MFNWLVVAQIRTLDPFFPHLLLATWFVSRLECLLWKCLCWVFWLRTLRFWSRRGSASAVGSYEQRGVRNLIKDLMVRSPQARFDMEDGLKRRRWQVRSKTTLCAEPHWEPYHELQRTDDNTGKNIVLKSYLVLCLWKMRCQQVGCKVERVWFNGCLK